MNKCIIFGGYGYIGSHLAESLKKKFKVYRYSNSDFNKTKKIKKFSYNLKNFRKYIKKINPKIIFFLSGNSYPNNSYNKSLYDFKRTNIVIQNFLTSLKELNFKGKIIYASSIAVYGKDKNFTNEYVNEKSPTNPKNYYGLSKILAENQFIYFQKKYKLKIYILRITSVFGLNLKKQVIYEMINKVKNHKSNIIKLSGKKNDCRQFLYIEDLIKIFLKLISLKKNYLLLNISNGKKFKIQSILNYILRSFKIKKKNYI